MPDLTYECRLPGLVAGIDEAGRGPLAGPVVAAAVILPRQGWPDGLNDSKSLSRTAREHLLNALQKTALIGVGFAEPEEIDRINILGATMMAMQRALLALPVTPDSALVDGNRAPDLPCHVQTLVKGDSLSLSVAAASIVAKVTRDRLMVSADKRFAGFNLSQHKGYPTAAHRAAVADLGPSPLHRLSFAPCAAARVNRS
ncbi:ribonuclease HII [Robiginitomaculum antarcticum]|uniref:ribonuclease HII n=1 Tax=Robiginitomaculum antarcticum TaxID=437507 RepID=UPI000374E956|nr:ribonuclease HII [Robiginitomaculum antarcticum]